MSDLFIDEETGISMLYFILAAAVVFVLIISWAVHDYVKWLNTTPPVLNVTSEQLSVCIACGALYNAAWNGEGEEFLCPNCSGAD